jgi:Fic family protein
MVSLVRRKRKGTTYYYLKHTIRRDNKQKVVYLGKKLPNKKELEEMKDKLLFDFYREEWYPKLENIRRGYAQEMKTRPKSLKEKDIQQFAVNFTYHSQRIEGSTLTLRDTQMLLEEGMTPPNRPDADVREAQAHRDIFFRMLRSKAEPSLDVLCQWHYELMQHSRPDIAGEIRKEPVMISGSKHVPPRPELLGYLLKSFYKWYKGKESNQLNPVERAALAHLKFVTIHPFGDGNGRISRLLMNHLLDMSQYPMFNIDYKDRRGYYNALERAQLREDDVIFLRWFMRRYIKKHGHYVRNA